MTTATQPKQAQIDCPQCGRPLAGQRIVGESLGHKCMCGWPVTSPSQEMIESELEASDPVPDESQSESEVDVVTRLRARREIAGRWPVYPVLDITIPTLFCFDPAPVYAYGRPAPKARMEGRRLIVETYGMATAQEAAVLAASGMRYWGGENGLPGHYWAVPETRQHAENLRCALMACGVCFKRTVAEDLSEVSGPVGVAA